MSTEDAVREGVASHVRKAEVALSLVEAYLSRPWPVSLELQSVTVAYAQALLQLAWARTGMSGLKWPSTAA